MSYFKFDICDLYYPVGRLKFDYPLPSTVPPYVAICLTCDDDTDPAQLGPPATLPASLMASSLYSLKKQVFGVSGFIGGSTVAASALSGQSGLTLDLELDSAFLPNS